MEPLADVLAVVGLAAGPFAVALEQAVGVELDQSVGLVDLDAAANPAAQADRSGVRKSWRSATCGGLFPARGRPAA